METKIRKRGFLSYAHEDRQLANKLFSDLQKLNIPVWYDQENFDPNQDVDDLILNAIKESYFIVVLLTNNSVAKNGYIRKEIKLALNIATKLENKYSFIIPIRAEDCTPLPEELHGFRSFIDLFPNWGKGMAKLDGLIPYQGGLLDMDKKSAQEIQADLASFDIWKTISSKLLKDRNSLSVFVENSLRHLKDIPENLVSRKTKNISRQIKDFSTCLELHFVENCGKADPKTLCHICNAHGSVIHGTIEFSGFSASDYNDNYVAFCTECFWSFYDFEIDYLGTGPLKFDYKKNIYA